MMATLLSTAGKHGEAIIDLAGHSLCVMDEFSSGQQDIGEDFDLHLCCQAKERSTVVNKISNDKRTLKCIGGWKYTAVGEVIWNEGTFIDCGIATIVHPSFLSPYNPDVIGKSISFEVEKLVGFILHHKSFELTTECHLVNIGDWSEEFVGAMTDIDSFDLQEEHWTVIYFLRKYFQEFGIFPGNRSLRKALGNKYSYDYLREMFPLGFAWQAMRYAGIPRPIEAYIG